MIPGFHGVELFLILIPFLFWLWMLVDCVLNRTLDDIKKILWLLLIFFTYIVGALVYFFAVRLWRYRQ